MKALICGNAPCFLTDIAGKDLSEFFIVRMNGFIEPPVLPCDAWSSWPDPTHRLKHARHEPMYDVAEYAQKTGELWLVHPGYPNFAINVFKRTPDYIMPVEQVKKQHAEVGSPPNLGMLLIRAAQLQPRFTEIYVAGFDHYEGQNDYYFVEGKFDHPAHKDCDNKRWFEQQLQDGRIKRL
jgi:hypothetical protein